MVNALILNTKGEGEKSSGRFLGQGRAAVLFRLIGYIWYEAEPEERNFITLLDLINASEARRTTRSSKARWTSCSPSWRRSARTTSP